MDGAAQKQLGLWKAESNNQAFIETMRSKARMLARRGGSVTSDDLRGEAIAMGIEPDHPNAWGAIFKGRDWEAVGFESSVHPSNHGRVIRRWSLKS